MHLFIGTPAWSSWSMRPWLALRRTGTSFEQTVITLRQGEETRAAIAPISPSGKVPCLTDGAVTVWDSLAICEYLDDRFPAAHLWPRDMAARALGRAAAAEMHSGFMALRNECPMALDVDPGPAELSEAVQADVRRIVRLWGDLLARYGAEGPFLTGAWSIADAFYTPVATRFRTYGVRLADYGDEGEAQVYCDALLETPEFHEWEALARAHAA
jgi:glutathione S-transferase